MASCPDENDPEHLRARGYDTRYTAQSTSLYTMRATIRQYLPNGSREVKTGVILTRAQVQGMCDIMKTFVDSFVDHVHRPSDIKQKDTCGNIGTNIFQSPNLGSEQAKETNGLSFSRVNSISFYKGEVISASKVRNFIRLVFRIA